MIDDNDDDTDNNFMNQVIFRDVLSKDFSKKKPAPKTMRR